MLLHFCFALCVYLCFLKDFNIHGGMEMRNGGVVHIGFEPSPTLKVLIAREKKKEDTEGFDSPGKEKKEEMLFSFLFYVCSDKLVVRSAYILSSPDLTCGTTLNMLLLLLFVVVIVCSDRRVRNQSNEKINLKNHSNVKKTNYIYRMPTYMVSL